MLNKVTLIGNVGKDPEVRTAQSGKRSAKFTLATSQKYKDKTTGERKTKTEWHNIVIFNEGIVQFVEHYLKKGARIYLEGQIETRKWQDDSGKDRYTTEIVIPPFGGQVLLMESKETSEVEQNHKAIAAKDPEMNWDAGDEMPF